MECSAEWYESNGAPITLHALELLLEALPEVEARVKEAKACLDVACGTGSGTMFLAKTCEKGTVTAVDVDEGMLKLLGAKLKLFGHGDVVVRKDDALTLAGVGDASHDLVLSIAGLPWVFEDREQRVAALASARRVLEPGGIFVFTTWVMDEPDSPMADDAVATAECVDAGWTENIQITQLDMVKKDLTPVCAIFKQVRIFLLRKTNEDGGDAPADSGEAAAAAA